MEDESSSSLNLDAQQPINTAEPQNAGIDMMQFLKDYSPINAQDVQRFDSELDFLRSISGFREFVGPESIHFNYYFDEESYSLYTKEQCALRLELTKFREEFVNEMKLKEKDILGYYYELGKFETNKFKPKDYDDGTEQYKPREESMRQGRQDSYRRDRK